MSRIMLGQPVSGLRSRLYPYQRESVSSMLLREMSGSDMPDPLYIPVTGLNKTVFYLQPATMEILRERPMVAAHHGGVLCEELGTGKTIMVLALVLVTIDQLSQPEESIHDSRPVMTPLAFRHFPYPQFEAARKSLSSPRPIPARDDHSFPRLLEMFLTSATLIVVPPNLLAQWNSEILKHCLGPEESDDALRYLVVNPKDELPAARLLATNYDIVLLNHETFSREESKFDRVKAFTWTGCECPDYKGTRVPKCSCDSSEISPLFRIRWKRLVVDEGHVHGTDKTNISKVANLLSVERRWLVTGTPTTNLLGINLRGSEIITDLQYPEDASEADDILQSGEELDPDTPDTDSVQATNTRALSPRTWTKYDREDLRRLGTMVVTFLQIPRFAAEPRLFGTHVVHTLFGTSGPQPGAVQVLTQVMSSIMIRHQIQDIENDVSLPPLIHETVLLDLDPLAVKSYNALQAAITINAVDSERKDQDYLFHSNNAAYLKQLVANMSQYAAYPPLFPGVLMHGRLMFWHVDEKRYNIDELSRATDAMVEKARERGVSLQDADALREAKTHIIRAANDNLWRSIQTYPTPEIPFVFAGIPERVLEAWSRASVANTIPYVPPAALKLRDLVLARPFIDEGRLIDAGHAKAEEDNVRNLLFLQSVRKRENAKGAKKRVVEENVRETRKAEEAARQRQDKVLEMQNELRLVLEHSQTEKFLIFSSMPLTLAHVADALTLAGVMFLQYTTASPVHIRQQYVTTFETSDKYRVFLMELKHGSRGLNLVSASRVIFCEPVWKADVEAQAIKRVHRIGQTKPIVAQEPGSESHCLLDRRFTMRNFIANPSFMQETTYEPLILNIPLLGGFAGAVDTGRSTENMSTNDPIIVVEGDPQPQEPQAPTIGEQPLLKKRRTVRFADES
ncbi:SNF2 family N-terminal domain-containing protein [Lactifluus volemus]|nr:SNF2 family N-terminal domain-containing protein [Lactifluus volemus]